MHYTPDSLIDQFRALTISADRFLSKGHNHHASQDLKRAYQLLNLMHLSDDVCSDVYKAAASIYRELTSRMKAGQGQVAA